MGVTRDLISRGFHFQNVKQRHVTRVRVI